MAMDDVTRQYTTSNLLERVLEGLRAVGKDPDNLAVADLAPVDHFHTLGLSATTGLADAAGLKQGDEVLDAGCGLGGPARTLAGTYGCRVTGIDLAPGFCEAAAELNRRVGLGDKIVIQQGNAVALPFGDDTFDVVWTMHVSMNIEDKAELYDQFARVLRPGGKLAFFDLIEGAGDLHLPVPWADDPAVNHLVDEEELRLLLSTAGFRAELWEDLTSEGAAFFRSLVPSPLGVHLLQSDMKPKLLNLARNLAEGRVRAIRSVCSYPG